MQLDYSDIARICGQAPEVDAGEVGVPQSDLVAECQIDLSKEITEPLPLLSIGEGVLFSEGNISTIGGAAKSCKTFLVCLLTACMLDHNMQARVLVVDTEMARHSTLKTARRIHRLAGWDPRLNNNRLKVFSLREYSAAERTAIFTQIVEKWQPSLVFLDGVRDLVRDFNSADESSETVNLLMRLTTLHNCHICSVLHENKVGGQLRGHLGTEIVNKSETVLGISRSGGVSTVRPLFTRNRPFDEFHFLINDKGLPEMCGKNDVKTKTDSVLYEHFERIFSTVKSLSYADLRNRLMKCQSISARTAERKIKEAIGQQLIDKNSNGEYCLYPSDETIQYQLPLSV